VAIAIYADGEIGFGVVDDRRRVTIANGTLVLDRIHPEAALPSLVIESADPSLVIGACMRQRSDTPDSLTQLALRKPGKRVGSDADEMLVTPASDVLSPQVRCSATGASGVHLVRVLYVAPAFRYRATHDVAMKQADRATITTHFTIPTPAWQMSADVTLFERLPGGEDPPKQIAAGTIKLDGSAATLALPARSTTARVLTVFDGGVRDDVTPMTDPSWNRESKRAVWTMLELDDRDLIQGVARVHLALPGQNPQDLVIAATDRERIGKQTLRLPLQVVHILSGFRRHWFEQLGDGHFAQRFELSVTNVDIAPREVWIEERLRPVRGRKLLRSWPTTFAIEKHAIRVKVVVPPNKTERIGFTVEYPR
jgi:hypothetical protein